MPRNQGWSKHDEREYLAIKARLLRAGYALRDAERIAAATVNKQRRTRPTTSSRKRSTTSSRKRSTKRTKR